MSALCVLTCARGMRVWPWCLPLKQRVVHSVQLVLVTARRTLVKTAEAESEMPDVGTKLK